MLDFTSNFIGIKTSSSSFGSSARDMSTNFVSNINGFQSLGFYIAPKEGNLLGINVSGRFAINEF